MKKTVYKVVKECKSGLLRSAFFSTFNDVVDLNDFDPREPQEKFSAIHSCIYKIDEPTLSTCKQTGEVKRSHRATLVVEDGKKVYYYNGRKFD